MSIQIRLLIASVDKAREMGLTWWWESPQQQLPRQPAPGRRDCPPILERGPPGRRPARPAVRGADRTRLRTTFTTSQQTERTLRWPKRTRTDPGARRRMTPAPASSRRTWASTSAASWEKLGSAVEKLVDLAQSGQTLSKTGELEGLDPEGKLRGVYGFSVRTAMGDQGQREVKIEPFGNLRREPAGERRSGRREPPVDVHEEEDHVLVLAEIPGRQQEGRRSWS